MHEELRLTIQNDFEELTRVSELASELLERHRIASRPAYVTQLALEEVLSNVIRHGYRDRDRHEISLSLRVGDEGIEVQVVDDGQEFDPATAPAVDLDEPLAVRRVGGLGVHLIRSFVTEIRYERRGEQNVLWLRV